MPEVSVAMAAYNGEKFLPEQLDSILSQLAEDDEVIISYDQSTDRTLEILQDYAARDARVQIFLNDCHGITGNFNNAISHCSGDFIFISDQDDRWADNKRDSVLACFKKTGADMVIHNGVHINESGRIISKPFFTMYRIGDSKVKNLLKPRYSGCCTAFTKKMASHILPIPKSIDAYDHWIGTIGEFYGSIAYLNQILLFHRVYGNNATPMSRRSALTIAKSRANLLRHLSARTLADSPLKAHQHE